MKISYPKNLPIISRKKDIIKAARDHQVIIIAGETGSGKTTQIAKMCLEAFPENRLLIGCTQPRRIAASTVANRVTEELGEYGHLVGYKIRFHDYTTNTTKIKFMTDGVLLAETRKDRLLSRYGILIIDEAHERNLNIDFLLGYIKRLLPKRPDLKIIITSATIDTHAFSEHFDNAPVLTVSGRTYPVTVHYNPIDENLFEEKINEMDHCVKTVTDLFLAEARGDILVFLPTERDIRECCTLLERKIKDAVILPMFGRLQSGDQKKIFQQFKKIKIIVATNVAETSVTVPGIKYVVDSGQARISHYNAKAKTTSLPVSKISRASCNQRKGRCGRIGPGICIRLYSEEDFENRPEYTLPELQRSNLAEVILQMISLNLGKPAEFPFIDPPHSSAIREGYRLLKELGAITPDLALTKIGKIMSDLPMDPCISRIIIAALENNCLREIKIICSVLAIQDPRIRPAEFEKDADTAHKRFAHPHSDFLALLNIWNTFHTGQDKIRSWSKLKKYCKSHYLSFQRMREWFDLHEQLERILTKRKGFTANNADSSYEQIHKSILTGFIRNIAVKRDKTRYRGAYNKELMIFPGSYLFSKSGQWLVAAGFIETGRLYALTVATIEPEWLETVAGSLCSFSWSNPGWHKKTGQVIANENVTLFGLQIVTDRRVNFGERHKKNIEEARNIFIQSALVQGETKGTYPFLQNNLSLIKNWEDAENRLRTRGIVADDLTLHNFYSERIPADVFDQKGFNFFLKKQCNDSFLRMEENDVLLRKPADNELVDYPPSVNIGSLEIRLEYNFVPGSKEDGVTFRLPIDFSYGVSTHFFQWLVPGLLHEKLTFLIKGLPKNIRKRLVPVAQSVNQILDDITFYSGTLYGAVESSILKQFKFLVRRSDWPTDIPNHLQPRFVLFDSSGKDLLSGRNLGKLLQSQSPNDAGKSGRILRKQEQKIVSFWEDRTFTTWGFEGLPETIPLYTQQGDPSGFLYPSLVPDLVRGAVRIHFNKNKQAAENQNQAGILYLYQLQFPGQHKSLKKLCRTSLSSPSSLWLYENVSNRSQILNLFVEFIMRSLFGPLSGTLKSKSHFNDKILKVKSGGLYKNGSLICNDLTALLRKRREVRDSIHKTFNNHNVAGFLSTDKQHLFEQLINEIVTPDFLTCGVYADIANQLRRLQSLAIRLERFSINPRKDAQKEKQLYSHFENLQRLAKREREWPSDAVELYEKYREMIAEFRILVFSPEIKTCIPVSSKKLQQLWQSILEKT
jgi:ATP-dependent helicase HrpA